MGHGEGLNLEINEEPAELTRSIFDRTQERWRKIRSHHWNAKELIGRCILEVFRKRPVRTRRQGVVGAGG
jgi:hypothetical protein